MADLFIDEEVVKLSGVDLSQRAAVKVKSKAVTEGHSSQVVIKWEFEQSKKVIKTLFEKRWLDSTGEVPWEAYITKQLSKKKIAESFRVPMVYGEIFGEGCYSLVMEDVGEETGSSGSYFHGQHGGVSYEMSTLIKGLASLNSTRVHVTRSSLKWNTPYFADFNRTRMAKIRKRVRESFSCSEVSRKYVVSLSLLVKSFKSLTPDPKQCFLNHCDIHPGNIRGGERGEVVIFDFGNSVMFPPVIDISQYASCSLAEMARHGVQASSLMVVFNQILEVYLNELKVLGGEYKKEKMYPLFYQVTMICIANKIKRGPWGMEGIKSMVEFHFLCESYLKENLGSQYFHCVSLDGISSKKSFFKNFLKRVMGL